MSTSAPPTTQSTQKKKNLCSLVKTKDPPRKKMNKQKTKIGCVLVNFQKHNTKKRFSFVSRVRSSVLCGFLSARSRFVLLFIVIRQQKKRKHIRSFTLSVCLCGLLTGFVVGSSVGLRQWVCQGQCVRRFQLFRIAICFGLSAVLFQCLISFFPSGVLGVSIFFFTLDLLRIICFFVFVVSFAAKEKAKSPEKKFRAIQ